MNTPSPRSVSARVISHWLISDDFPDRLIPDSTEHRGLVQEMVYGTVRWKKPLLWILAKMVSREPDDQTKGYLLIGLYQLFMMDNIPPHAALNETVEAAKLDLDPARVKFINGVLRNSLRCKTEIECELAEADIGVRLSHPDLLVSRWTRQYGPTLTTALCERNNRRPDVVIRINSDNTPEAQELRSSLTPHPANPESYYVLTQGTQISELPGYEAGVFSVQDPATQIAVSLLDLAPGNLRLLDACAAPGGKTFACADIIKNQGTIFAADLHEDRIKRLKQNVQRMNFSCIQIVQADARQIPPPAVIAAEAPFDRILLDVPCSNTGVLSRRPDARWRFTEERLEGLLHTQRQMLDAACHLLANGGIMVYSTCSLEPEENMLQIQSWLTQHPEFHAGRQSISMPPESGMDGAFAIQLIKS